MAVDGGYAKREFLKPAIKAGFVVVARLRKDAALCDLPPALPPGQKRGRGRPPTYGKNRLSLARRAGQTRGWAEVTVKATTGRSVVKRSKTFLATWRPAGGLVRVVILKEEDGSWRAFLSTDAGAGVEAIVQVIHDRWAIEQNYHDLKEVERVEQVQLRRVWSNVGAFNLSLWVHTLVEVWAWGRPEASLSDRGDRPWDDASRRPSHADRRRALQR
ncbi:MAG TPA: transposase, partial [Acidimicrobiia bacterium]